jgi:hypothetical protein
MPSVAATAPIASSGMLVPIDTTVKPITIGGMPSRPASREPPRMRTSAPRINAMSPVKNQATSAIIARDMPLVW